MLRGTRPYEIWAIPQKMLPHGEKRKLTYINKGCFPMKINKEVLPFDDEVKKVRNNMTNCSIIVQLSKEPHILQEL